MLAFLSFFAQSAEMKCIFGPSPVHLSSGPRSYGSASKITEKRGKQSVPHGGGWLILRCMPINDDQIKSVWRYPHLHCVDPSGHGRKYIQYITINSTSLIDLQMPFLVNIDSVQGFALFFGVYT